MTAAAVLTVAPERATTIIRSDVLGELVVPDDALLDFPQGLLGLPECRRFALVAVEGRQGLFWLQSADYSALAFVLVDPFAMTEGYLVDLPECDRREIGAEAPSDVAVLAIVTLPRSADEPCTANLQGPLAINMRQRVGRQMVLSDGRYGIREPVDLARCGGEGRAVGGGQMPRVHAGA